VIHLVPILDEGVTLDRGDHFIVLLDGAGVPDVAATPAGLAQAVGQLIDKLGAPKHAGQKRTEET